MALFSFVCMTGVENSVLYFYFEGTHAIITDLIWHFSLYFYISSFSFRKEFVLPIHLIYGTLYKPNITT